MLLSLAASVGLLACTQIEIPPYLRPLSNETISLLGKKGMTTATPMFIRIFKEESELELWKQREDGRYYHFKTYPICNWSGTLGPKLQQGDMQAPEGFYPVNQRQLNPNSQFHLAFNLGYPNAYDRANRRTGEFLMIHGKCKSAGCYAMTDALIEEIYALARESFIGGQEVIHVHAFPFRMTQANMDRHKANPHYKFWLTLQEGYNHFEATRQTPEVAVCERRYVVNVKLAAVRQKPNPEGACPTFERPAPAPFTPLPTVQATETIVVDGPKVRAASNAAGGGSSTDGGINGSIGRAFGVGAGSSALPSGTMLGFGR